MSALTKIHPLPTVHYTPLARWQEQRPAALVYSAAALRAARDASLRLPLAWQGEVTEATEAHWRQLGTDLRGEVIYAVGGGLAMDAGKYLAQEHGLPLIGVPTAISVDAPWTWAAGVRRDGCVRYLETGPPQLLLLDFELLAAAPPQLRAAGICDVLSIATGLWDWRFAEREGRNSANERYVTYAAGAAEAILQGALACAAAAGRGAAAGLRQLCDCLALEVQLCNQLGHSRPEEGSEHYFAYAVENMMGKGLPHGDLVGPGIVLLAGLQGQDTAPLRDALRACQIPARQHPAGSHHGNAARVASVLRAARPAFRPRAYAAGGRAGGAAGVGLAIRKPAMPDLAATELAPVAAA